MTSRGEERRVGEIAGGKYRLVRFLAAGGMGVVYEAQHTVVKRRFAVKFLRPELAEKRESLARFQREAQAAGALESEHVAAAVDFGVAADGSPFIVMEYLVGESVASVLEREGRLPVERAAELVVQASRGIQAAHAAGIVHRDLKPQNLFLCRREDGTDFVKVLDFGVAKLEAADGDAATRTGTVLGTPSYMSPEQARGDKAIDHRVDVYALGAISYELVSGKKPHPGDSHNAILHHIATQPAVPLDFIEPALPAPIVASIERALAADPTARFDTAEQLAHALAPFAERRVWPAPERAASNPRHDAASEPTELEPVAAERALAPTRVIGAQPGTASARRVPKAALIAVAGAAALVVWFVTRPSEEPSPVAPARAAEPAPLAARPAAAVNAGETPLPVAVQAKPAPASSIAPELERPRPEPVPSKATKAPPRPERAPAPEPVSPEPVKSAPSLAFDRRNPYD